RNRAPEIDAQLPAEQHEASRIIVQTHGEPSLWEWAVSKVSLYGYSYVSHMRLLLTIFCRPELTSPGAFFRSRPLSVLPVSGNSQCRRVDMGQLLGDFP